MKVLEEPCVACDAKTVTETDQWCDINYGDTGFQSFKVFQPIMKCSSCSFEWTDYRGEEACDAAQEAAQLADPARWVGSWYPISSAPMDGSRITVRDADGYEEEGVYYAESRYCMIGAPQGSKGPGWVSTEAGHLPIDAPFEWKASKIKSHNHQADVIPIDENV